MAGLSISAQYARPDTTASKNLFYTADYFFFGGGAETYEESDGCLAAN